MSQAAPTLYELLGVGSDASEDVIAKAYRDKARILHPDKNRDDPDAASKFDAIKRARDTLLDPTERAALDGKLRRQAEEDARDAAQTSERREMREALRKREREQKESPQDAAARAASAASMQLEAETALRAFKLRIAKVEHHHTPAVADAFAASRSASVAGAAAGLIDSVDAFEDASLAAQHAAIVSALKDVAAHEAANGPSAASRLVAALPPGYPPAPVLPGTFGIASADAASLRSSPSSSATAGGE